MATTQLCPGILQVNMVWESDGQRIENVFHADNGTGAHWSPSEIEAQRGAFQAYWESHAKLICASEMVLTQIVLTDLTDLAGLRRVEQLDPISPGSGGSPILPLNVTKAFELFTGSRGRGVNGKVYWPGAMENQVVQDAFSTPFITACVAALEWLRAEVPTATPGAHLAVLSRYLNKVKRALGIGREVTAITVPNTVVDNQRDRLPGHKRRKKRAITLMS